jgi:hypothetical protein
MASCQTAGEGHEHYGSANGRIEWECKVKLAGPDEPLFFEYVWPATAAELAMPDPIDDWDAGLVGYAVDDIRDIEGGGPLIELKARDLEQARGEAAEYWLNQTGLNPSEDPPEGYTIWDERGGCKFTYRLPRDS